MQTAPVITLFGTSKTNPGDDVFEMARTLGRRLAAAGFTIANGGYGGTMLAAAMGAAEAGGHVIGVTCRAFKRGRANIHISREIATDCLADRLARLIELGDAYVALPGGTGTLLEVADVWEHKNKGFSNADKPIILVGTFWRPLVKLMAEADADSSRSVECVDNADDAVTLLLAKVKHEQGT